MSTIQVNEIENTSGDSSISIDGNGNVSVPENLSVTGTTSLTDDLNVDSGTLFVDASENRVGIGTTSPTGLLHISSSAPALYMTDTTNNTEGVISMDNAGSLVFNADLNNEASSSNVRFAVDGSEAMRIDSSGNVDIAQSGAFPGAGNTTTGLRLASEGRLFASADGSSYAANFNVNADGEIIRLRKDGSTVGSIGYTSTGLQINGEANHTGIRFGSGAFVPQLDGSDSDGTQGLGNSSVRWEDLYLSGGVYLGGTGSANKLDDYEEGTWNPTENNSITLTDNTTPKYVKVGGLVHLWFDFTVASNSNGNSFDISNIPFAASEIGSAGGVVYFCDMNNSTADAGLSFNFNFESRALLRSGYDSNVTLATMSGHRIAGCLIYRTTT